MRKKPAARQKTRSAKGSWWLLSFVLALGACDGAKKMTANLHAYKQANSGRPVHDGAGSSGAAQEAEAATLEVTVVPAAGISVLIDGKRVADTSPCVTGPLAPGQHVLVVRAMGYYEVVLPVDLTAKQRLVVPVALRPRPAAQVSSSAPVPGSAARSPQSAAAGPDAHGGVPGAPGVATRPQGSPLPAGARAMIVQVTLSPPGPLVVDGVLMPTPQARLAQGTGELSLAGATMAYRIYPGHVLELTVPHDDAAWFRDGSQVKATSLLRLEGRPMALRRVTPAGATQQLTLRRLE